MLCLRRQAATIQSSHFGDADYPTGRYTKKGSGMLAILVFRYSPILSVHHAAPRHRHRRACIPVTRLCCTDCAIEDCLGVLWPGQTPAIHREAQGRRSKEAHLTWLTENYGTSATVTYPEWLKDILHGFAGESRVCLNPSTRGVVATSLRVIHTSSSRRLRLGQSQRTPCQPRRRLHCRGRCCNHIRNTVSGSLPVQS